jgi:hypothetical protein
VGCDPRGWRAVPRHRATNEARIRRRARPEFGRRACQGCGPTILLRTTSRGVPNRHGSAVSGRGDTGKRGPHPRRATIVHQTGPTPVAVIVQIAAVRPAGCPKDRHRGGPVHRATLRHWMGGTGLAEPRAPAPGAGQGAPILTGCGGRIARRRCWCSQAGNRAMTRSRWRTGSADGGRGAAPAERD